ncbi:MAG: hypothetical protein ACOCUR_00410 [Nanoarchaeota archaeon]
MLYVFGKKADGDVSASKFMLYIAYSFMIAFAFVAFVGTLSSASNKVNIIPEGIEKNQFIERAFLSPLCFAYQDETGRSYNIIDYSKFENETLERCLALDGIKHDFRFELTFEEEETYFDNTGDHPVESTRIIERNGEAYTTGWFGSHFREAYDVPVLVKKEGEIFPGVVRVSTQISSREFR